MIQIITETGFEVKRCNVIIVKFDFKIGFYVMYWKNGQIKNELCFFK